MKIRKLHIEKYKVFDDATFDFIDKEGKTLDTIVLAGVNGCGKTSVLELIKDILNYDRLGKNSIEIDIVISNKYREKLNTITWTDNSKEKKMLETLSQIYIDEFLVNIPLPILSENNSNILSYSRSQLQFFMERGNIIYFPCGDNMYVEKNVKILHISIKKNMEESMLKSVRDEIFKNKEISPKQTIENAVQKVNYLLSDFKLNTRLVDFESERMIFESLNGEKIYFDDLSNGEKQLYFRAISLYQLNINEGIILVDEPEDSMHPTWQKAIISLYQKIGTNNQVIVATHSPHVMASVKPESLFLLHIDEKENGRKVQVLNMAKEGKHSKGLEPNRILKEIMEVEMLRNFETQQAIDELTKLLNIQDFEKEETTNLIAQLTTDLGKQDPFILKVNHQILMLNRQKEKLNHATY